MAGGPPSTSGLPFPQPAGFGFIRRNLELNHNKVNLIGAAGAVRVSHSLGRHLRLEALLRSSLSKISGIGHETGLGAIWHDRGLMLQRFNFLGAPGSCASATYTTCLSFFGGDSSGKSTDEGMASSETPTRNSSMYRRRWTSVLIAANVLVFVAQFATKGKLMLWGAKINSLIDKGQLWRLVTSSFLHANIGHLMVNCYSLNSVGPTVESLCGSKRFLSIYFASALASAGASYWFCKSPAVGASGAIFGLVGSVAMFVIRHRGTMKGGKEELRHIANVIFLNMAIGLMSKGIDNWGHLGGLVGGFITSWLIGPAWKLECFANDGRRVYVDNAPIRLFINSKKGSSGVK
ncbi:unnamed protein product [Rhodiola kirilowii]